MRDIRRNVRLVHGAAAALVALAAALPIGAQGPPQPAKSRTRDSLIVRVLDADVRARLDSLKVIVQALNDEPQSSPMGAKLRAKLEAAMQELIEVERGRGFPMAPLIMKKAPDA